MSLTFQPDALTIAPYTPVQPNDLDLWHHMVDALHQSGYRVVSQLIIVLPGLLALIFALCLLTGLGMLLSFLVRRALTAAGFDERIGRNKANAIADWSPAHSPTALVGRILFWGCVLLGLIVGISALDASLMNGTAVGVSLLPYLTRSVGAVLLLFAGNVAARFFSRTVLIGAVNNQLQYARFLSMGVKWLVLVLTGAMVLDYLQIGGAIIELAFGILFGGIVLTLSLAIGLGSRDLVSRSLERTAESPDNALRPDQTATAQARETLRHF